MQKRHQFPLSVTTDYTVTFPTVYSYAFPMIAFLVPLVVSGPQVVVGSIVNCFLILSASIFSRKQLVLIAVLPSVGAVINGVVFGSLTPYLLYFLPAIWIGNVLLMMVWQVLVTKGVVLSFLMSAIMKSVCLSLFALAFVNFRLVPQAFLFAMSAVQFITAIVGGSLASVIIHYQQHYARS